MTLSEWIAAIDELRRELIKLKGAAETGAFPHPKDHENREHPPEAADEQSKCPPEVAVAASIIKRTAREVAEGLPAETAVNVLAVADRLAVKEGNWCDREMPHWLLKKWPTASAGLRWTSALTTPPGPLPGR
jgi:hypothetical protein